MIFQLSYSPISIYILTSYLNQKREDIFSSLFLMCYRNISLYAAWNTNPRIVLDATKAKKIMISPITALIILF